MNKYNFILNLSGQDIAGVLTCCGYALREEVSLRRAMDEMGFEIDVPDFNTNSEICFLAFFALTQITPRS